MKIEISEGELLDKITILDIKLKKINDQSKLMNIQKEYDYLMEFYPDITDVDSHFEKLLEINNNLWIVEDKLREFEEIEKFDNEFIELARSVYFLNDERARVKKSINMICNSSFIEEKSYKNM